MLRLAPETTAICPDDVVSAAGQGCTGLSPRSRGPVGVVRAALAAALLEDFGALEPEDRNLARRAFPPDQPGGGEPAELYGISDAARFRRQVVAELRAATARHPTDPALDELVEELALSNSLFAELWRRHDVSTAPALTKTFHHPVVGATTLDCDALHLTEQDQTLVLHTAPVGSRAADALSFLGALGHQPLSAT